MPYPISFELYRAPGFYAWFSKEPRPHCVNLNVINDVRKIATQA